MGLKKIRLGPIRHEQLPPEVIARLQQVRVALGDACPLTEAEWRETFQRDAHPEQELVWWERVADCYVEFTSVRSFSRSERQAAFNVVFGLFSGLEAEQLAGDLEQLPEEALDDLGTILNRTGRLN